MSHVNQNQEDPTISELAARQKIWLVDSKGLITSQRGDSLEHHKQPYAHELSTTAPSTLLQAVQLIQPTALFGLSTVGQSFTKDVCKEMVRNAKAVDEKAKPLIFALSNPTSKAECTAQQAYEWCDGEVVYASGSPMDEVFHLQLLLLFRVFNHMSDYLLRLR